MITVKQRDPNKPRTQPTSVEIVIADKVQLKISWQEFTQLASCCHEFESSYMPEEVQFGAVTVKML